MKTNKKTSLGVHLSIDQKTQRDKPLRQPFKRAILLYVQIITHTHTHTKYTKYTKEKPKNKEGRMTRSIIRATICSYFSIICWLWKAPYLSQSTIDIKQNKLKGVSDGDEQARDS